MKPKKNRKPLYQRIARREARKRDRIKKAKWRYLSLTHVCPSSNWGRGTYLIFDDKSKQYILYGHTVKEKGTLKANNRTWWHVTTDRSIALAHTASSADWIISLLKGTGGAWRPININK